MSMKNFMIGFILKSAVGDVCGEDAFDLVDCQLVYRFDKCKVNAFVATLFQAFRTFKGNVVINYFFANKRFLYSSYECFLTTILLNAQLGYFRIHQSFC